MLWYIRVVRYTALLLLAVGLLFLTLAFLIAKPAFAATGINKQVNYQARLLDSTGGVVPDGTYNIEFKIYQDGDGCVGGGTAPCSGTLLWTETRTSTNRVTVTNGYFSAMLGEVTAFGTSVDWNQDTLWLSINIGGTAGTPSWDGEMTPFRRFAAAPYAMNSQQLGGLNWDKFIQLAPSAVQTDSSTLNSISINKTGASGNILQLQKNGSNVMVVNNTGSVLSSAFDTISAGTLSLGTSTANALTFGSNTNNTPVTINSGTGAINIGTGAQARTINIGTGSAAQTLTLGSSNASSIAALTGGDMRVQAGDDAIRVITSDTSNPAKFCLSADSYPCITEVGNNDNMEFFTPEGITIYTDYSKILRLRIDYDGDILIGQSDTTGAVLTLDTKTDTGDPTGISSGSMYYNSNYGKFRCYEAATWKDCISNMTDVKTATQSTTSTTLTTVTSFGISLLATTDYSFTCKVVYTSASTTAGLAVAMNANSTVMTYSARIPQAASGTAGAFNGWGTSSGIAITATGTPAVTNNYLATIDGFVTTGTATTLQLRFARGGSTSAAITIQPGTSCTAVRQ